MKWYWISTITLLAWWAIGCVIAGTTDDERFLQAWAMGIVFPILFCVLYPIRAVITYNNSKPYYEKHKITRLQYLLGKRVHKK